MMSDRKAELERKKAKLQAMRDEKKRKEEEKKKTQLEAVPAAQPTQGDLRTETEQMLADLGIPPPAEGGTGSPARPSTLAPPDGKAPIISKQTTSHRTKITLTTSQVTQTNIPPREMVSYSKETQTISVEKEAHADVKPRAERSRNQVISGSNLSSTRSSSPASSRSGQMGQSPRSSLPHPYGSPRFVYPLLEWDDEFPIFQDDDNDSLDVNEDTPPSSAHPSKMPHAEMARPADTHEDTQKPEVAKPPPVRDLTEDEKNMIVNRDDFHRFMDRSTRLLERALCEGVDIFIDYAGGDDDQGESGLGEGEKLKLNRQFYDERWSKHRTITSLDWSTQHPELLLASYNNNEESPHEPDGVALIWNIKYKKNSPEYIFHCQSAVMSSCFAKFHPNLVVGGTYSGQIVLWDNRSNKKTPVQRTPLSAAAHTHPVYCVNVVGTQNAHNLISVSSDGKMCSWSLDMLSQPQDSMELQHKQARAAAVTSFSFLSGDVNNFVIGSEEAAVYTACRHGSKAGINEMFESHQGPITGIDCHTVPGQIDFSHYFITSSFDWTVKLWSIKENKPLHSFEDNSDYVYDARWSPIHPALFATVDGMGRLDMWNLNNDTEVPTASTIVETNTALNKCRWHQGGHSIAVGDDLGRVYIYDVGETLAQPRHDEWPKFVHTLQDLQTNKAEQEEEALNFGTSPLR